LKEVRKITKESLLQQALKKHPDRISSAVADLGISQATLYELMENPAISRK